MLRICFLRKNKTLRALLLSKTSRSQIELTKKLQAELAEPSRDDGSETSEKDAITERIEAALNECELSATRAVQINVDQFLRYGGMQILCAGKLLGCAAFVLNRYSCAHVKYAD